MQYNTYGDDELVKEMDQLVSVSSRPATQPEIEYFNTLVENQCRDLCTSGKCNADCCGCVSFPERHFMMLKKLIPESKEYFPAKVKEGQDTYIKPITKDCKCVFLTNKNTCAIHNSHLRPAVCKRFGEDRIEPLFACTHINQDLAEEINEFGRVYLENQANAGNSVASRILDKLNSDEE